MLKEETTLHLFEGGVVVEEKDGLISKVMLPTKGEFTSHDDLVDYAALVGQAVQLSKAWEGKGQEQKPEPKSEKKKGKKRGWQPTKVEATLSNRESFKFNSIKEAAKVLGLNPASISKVTSKKGSGHLRGIKFRKV